MENGKIWTLNESIPEGSTNTVTNGLLAIKSTGNSNMAAIFYTNKTVKFLSANQLLMEKSKNYWT